MYEFQVSIHAWPPDRPSQVPVALHGVNYKRLEIDPRQLHRRLPATFEHAMDCLARLPRMFVEPDGAFVWVSGQGGQAESSWQVDGYLYDLDERLFRIDLAGKCPADQFERLLTCFGWRRDDPATGGEETRFVFQLKQQALFLDEQEFRRYAQRPG